MNTELRLSAAPELREHIADQWNTIERLRAEARAAERRTTAVAVGGLLVGILLGWRTR